MWTYIIVLDDSRFEISSLENNSAFIVIYDAILKSVSPALFDNDTSLLVMAALIATRKLPVPLTDKVACHSTSSRLWGGTPIYTRIVLALEAYTSTQTISPTEQYLDPHVSVMHELFQIIHESLYCLWIKLFSFFWPELVVIRVLYQCTLVIKCKFSLCCYLLKGSLYGTFDTLWWYLRLPLVVWFILLSELHLICIWWWLSIVIFLWSAQKAPRSSQSQVKSKIFIATRQVSYIQ